MRRIRLAFPLAVLLLLADCTTKELAVEHLSPEHVPHPVLGTLLRWTLAYNDGVAMSLPVGPNVRWPLVAITVLIVIGLGRVALATPPALAARQMALGLVLGGALGNLQSRVTSSQGVVDFIDVGIGAHRFYLFNVADIAITIGACALAYSAFRAGHPPGAPTDAPP